VIPFGEQLDPRTGTVLRTTEIEYTSLDGEVVDPETVEG
jgi:hypothetical protein